jgi:thiamine pyrophosphokinase
MGAFGGRFDQTLATALIAARYAEAGVEIALLDGIHDAYPLPEGRRYDEPLPEGTVFSLLSVAERSRVDVGGAAYALRDAELPRGVGLGLSNVARGGPVVAVREGLVLLIVEWDA